MLSTNKDGSFFRFFFTLKIWKTIQAFFVLSKKLSILTELGYLGDFIPAQRDRVFKNWSYYGLRYLHHVFSKSDLKSFEQLRHDFILPQTNFYRYLQLTTSRV